jgi:hypothetical protein
VIPVPVPVAIAIAVAVAVRMAVRRRKLHWRPGLDVLGGGVQSGQPQADFSGSTRLPGVAAAKDDVLHLVAAQALGALLTEHPGNGIRHIALAAPVRTHDRGDSLVECELRTIGKGLETVNLETF